MPVVLPVTAKFPSTVRVLVLCVSVTLPLLKLITPPEAKKRSDHILVAEPRATPSEVVGIAGIDPEDAPVGSAVWAEYLVDVLGYNKIQGQPFKISELVDKIEEVLAL